MLQDQPGQHFYCLMFSRHVCDNRIMNEETTNFHLSTILFHRDALFLSACLEGNDLIVREGLSKGVDPNCSDGEGVTGLMKAITRGENQVGQQQDNLYIVQGGGDVVGRPTDKHQPVQWEGRTHRQFQQSQIYHYHDLIGIIGTSYHCF